VCDDGRVDDLIAFATARLDEYEAAAKAAASVAGPGWHHGHFDHMGSRPTAMIFSAAGSPLADMLHYDDEEMAPFIVRHDPARVLREVEAKRAIVSRCAEAIRDQGIWGEDGQAALAEDVLRHLAAIYSDHPDYRQEWKITAG
jgi:Family of unknown function (DUF6221)